MPKPNHYTEAEVREMLWQRFESWFRGKTCPMEGFYRHDVDQFMGVLDRKLTLTAEERRALLETLDEQLGYPVEQDAHRGVSATQRSAYNKLKDC